MRTSTMGVLVVLALAIPGVGAAQPRPKLAIGTIRGDASRARRQILLQVCETYDCVAASKVTTSNRPDPQKLQAAGVAGYLGGAVTGEPKERRLVLSLTTPSSTASKPARTWRLRLASDGGLRAQALERLGTELDQALQGSGGIAVPSPAAPPQPPPPAARPSPALAPQPPPKPQPAAQVSEARSDAPAASAGRALRVAGEVGVWVTNRKLDWSGATPGVAGPLRTYDADAILAPTLRLELYPGAFMGASPLWSGIGVYARYAQSFGLKVTPPSGSTDGNHDGKLTRFELGAVWRLRPVSGSRFVVAPALGYRTLQVTTSPAIDGLPDTRPSGYELRVDTEVPVSPSIALLGGGGYTLWTAKKEIVGSYFGKGSAHGLELEAGASWSFHGPLSARALVEYQSISYTGLSEPRTDFGTASSAKDGYLGGRLMLRAEY
jgi:hypothetical protein